MLLRRTPLLRATAIGGGAYCAVAHLRQRRARARLAPPPALPAELAGGGGRASPGRSEDADVPEPG